jgi:hypothetical protein
MEMRQGVWTPTSGSPVNDTLELKADGTFTLVNSERTMTGTVV